MPRLCGFRAPSALSLQTLLSRAVESTGSLYVIKCTLTQRWYYPTSVSVRTPCSLRWTSRASRGRLELGKVRRCFAPRFALRRPVAETLTQAAVSFRSKLLTRCNFFRKREIIRYFVVNLQYFEIFDFGSTYKSGHFPSVKNVVIKLNLLDSCRLDPSL